MVDYLVANGIACVDCGLVRCRCEEPEDEPLPKVRTNCRDCGRFFMLDPNNSGDHRTTLKLCRECYHRRF